MVPSVYKFDDTQGKGHFQGQGHVKVKGHFSASHLKVKGHFKVKGQIQCRLSNEHIVKFVTIDISYIVFQRSLHSLYRNTKRSHKKLKREEGNTD